MELLPQSKIKDLKRGEREAETAHRIEIGQHLIKEEKMLAESVKNIDPEKRKLQKEFDQFRAKIEKRTSELLCEIQTLEVKRDSAMQPYYDLKATAIKAMNQVDIMQARVSSEAQKVNKMRLEVERGKKELEKREELLAKREKENKEFELSLVNY